MARFPYEIIRELIRLLFASENGSPATLNAISLCSHSTNHLARQLQFKTVTISTYLDLLVHQRLALNAPHLLKHTKTLRLVRLVGEESSGGFEDFITSGPVISPLHPKIAC